MATVSTDERPRKPNPQAPTPRSVLSGEFKKEIYGLYGIGEGALNISGVVQCEDRVAIPIWCDGRQAGWEMRKLPPYNGERKSMHYRNDPSGLWIGEFGPPASRSTPVWLVEDTWSAMKVSQEMALPSIALMGTHISLDTATYLRYKANNYYLALDRDASEKAMVYKRKYSMILPNLRPVFLSKDLKYLNRDQIKELIN